MRDLFPALEQAAEVAEDVEVFGKFHGGNKLKGIPYSLLRDRWDKLDAAGIPLEPLEHRTGIEERYAGRALTIRQEGIPGDSVIRELKNGQFAFVAKVLVRRDLPGKSTIRDAYLTPPWIDTDIEWLEASGHDGKNRRWFSFPGEVEQFYPGEVLNDRIRCTLARGDIREGLVLAVSPVRPPEEFRNNDNIRVTFTIMDQWDVAHSVPLRLWLHRFPTQVKERPKGKRGSLLDRPDNLVKRSRPGT